MPLSDEEDPGYPEEQKQPLGNKRVYKSVPEKKKKCSLLAWLAVVLKVWCLDQQHQHHPEACQKCRISVLTPYLLNQKPGSRVTPLAFSTLKSEKHCSNICLSPCISSINIYDYYRS